MLKKSLFFGVMAVVVSVGFADVETQKEVDALVEGLGATSFKDRNSADKSLRDCSRDIAPLLEKYRNIDDPEVSGRVSLIIEFLETKPPTLRSAGMKIVPIKDRVELSEDIKLMIMPDRKAVSAKFISNHRILRIDPESSINGKSIPADILEHAPLSLRNHNNKEWEIFVKWDWLESMFDVVRPGKYSLRMVVSDKNMKYICSRVSVEVYEPKGGMGLYNAYIKSGTKSFLHGRGYRPNGSSEKQIDYDAVCDFLEKYPDSKYQKRIEGQLTSIGTADIAKPSDMHPDDRKGVAAIAVLVMDDYVVNTEKYLTDLKKNFENLTAKADPEKHSGFIEMQKSHIDLTELWLKHAKEAEAKRAGKK